MHPPETVHLWADYSDRFYGYGHDLFAVGEYAAAVDCFLTAIFAAPRGIRNWIGLGACYRCMDQLDQADQVFAYLEILAPSDPEVLFRRAETAHNRRDITTARRAAQACQQVIAKFPAHPLKPAIQDLIVQLQSAGRCA